MNLAVANQQFTGKSTTLEFWRRNQVHHQTLKNAKNGLKGCTKKVRMSLNSYIIIVKFG